MFEKIKTPEELFKYIKENIKYGFISSNDNKKYIRKDINNDSLYDEYIKKYYYLQTPEELLKTKIGLCYDQVELMRNWLIKHNYEVLTYYSSYHHHSILIYKENNKYCLIETSLPRFNGIFKFNSINECLKFYKKIQEKNMNKKIQDIKLFKYNKGIFNENFFKYVCDNCKIKKEDILL